MIRLAPRAAAAMVMVAGGLAASPGTAWAPSHRELPPSVTRPTIERTGPWADLTAQQVYERLHDRFDRVKDRFVRITDRLDAVLDRLEAWNASCESDAGVLGQINELRSRVDQARQEARGLLDGIPNLPGTYAPGIKDTLLALHRDLKDARLTLAGIRDDVRGVVHVLAASCPRTVPSTTVGSTTTTV